VSRHLTVAISPHGYGHAAQIAPVVNELTARLPKLRVTLATAVPRRLLSELFAGPFEVAERRSDFGMVMGTALDLRVEESARAYEALHVNWNAALQAEAEWLAGLGPNLVLANVPYLTLAAAAEIGVPAVALCSLNWAEIHAHYCGDAPRARRIEQRIRAAYGTAAAFIRPEPALVMDLDTEILDVGPIARLGRDRREEIRARLGADARDRLVLLAPGGAALDLPTELWPAIPGVRWLVQDGLAAARPDMAGIASLDIPFIDALASADALVTKPGYSTFVEAGCGGVPVLYVRRDGWPEEPGLVAWLTRHVPCRELDRADLMRGAFAESLEALWTMPRPAPARATGVEAAALIAGRWLG
jgi:hypothetical protein